MSEDGSLLADQMNHQLALGRQFAAKLADREGLAKVLLVAQFNCMDGRTAMSKEERLGLADAVIAWLKA